MLKDISISKEEAKKILIDELINYGFDAELAKGIMDNYLFYDTHSGWSKQNGNYFTLSNHLWLIERCKQCKDDNKKDWEIVMLLSTEIYKLPEFISCVCGVPDSNINFVNKFYWPESTDK